MDPYPVVDPEDSSSDESSVEETATGSHMNLPLKKKPEKEKARWTDEEVRPADQCVPAVCSAKSTMRRAVVCLELPQDETLRRLVQQMNAKNWKQIANGLPGKTEVQCLHRWTKVLNPNVVKGPWSAEVSLSMRR